MIKSRNWTRRIGFASMTLAMLFVAGHAMGTDVPGDTAQSPPPSKFNPFNPTTPLKVVVAATDETKSGASRPGLRDPFRPPVRSPYTP